MRNLLVIAMCALLAACGGGLGGSSLSVKIGGKDSSMAVKSSVTSKSVFTYSPGGGAPPITATSMTFVLANYEADTTNIATMKKPLTSADQMRVFFSVNGEEGTDLKGEIKPGTYKVDPSGKWMKVGSFSVTTFADGKESDTSFDMMFSGSKATGEIKIASVTADEISGSIDITEGDKSVKGNFTAKAAKK